MTPVTGATLPLLLPNEAVGSLPSSTELEKSGGAEFGEMLASVVASTNTQLNQAKEAGEAFAAGASDDIHGTMLALSQADIQLKLVGSVRNRVIDAFYELWRMQI